MLRLRWWNLRARIIAWSFVPTAIILLTVALVTFYAYQHITADLVVGRNRELTRLSASQLAEAMDEYTDVLSSVASTVGGYAGNAAQQQAALDAAASRLVVFDSGVVLLDSQGKVTASVPGPQAIAGQDWSSHGYFRQLVRTRTAAFSDIVDSGPEDAEVIVLAVPVSGQAAGFAGALAGMFRVGATGVSAFYGSVVKLRIGNGGSAYLVDSAGRVIYHSDPDHVGQDFSQLPVVQQVLARRAGHLRTTDLSGAGILASYAPVPGAPWGLVVEESWTELLASSQGYARFLYVLLGLGVVVPALVVMFAVKRITDPIADLIGAAQRVAGGDFGQTIDVHTGDELEELGKQFNLMSAQLAESYALLERRVAARTKELAALNAIAAGASRSLDLQQILHDALEKTIEVMGMQVGSAYRLEADGHTLTMIACRGLPEGLRGTSEQLQMAETSARAFREMRPVVTEIASYPDGLVKDLLLQHGVQLAVVIPLVAKGRPCGVMQLGASDLRPLAPEELSLLAAIGQQIGVAMENARLYGDAEHLAVAAERNRLARELHDAVSQTLFSASLIAEVLPRLWQRNPDEARRRLEELRQLTRGALAEMRTLLLELRPAALTEAALGDLLRQLAEAIAGRSRVPVTVTIEGQGTLPPDVQVALYRIAQESLNNVARHSAAANAAVALRHLPAAQDSAEGQGGVELSIVDDGQGCDPSSVTSEHLGLGIMRERAEAIGAALAIWSRPGQGTRVQVVWPGSVTGEPALSSGQEGGL